MFHRQVNLRLQRHSLALDVIAPGLAACGKARAKLACVDARLHDAIVFACHLWIAVGCRGRLNDVLQQAVRRPGKTAGTRIGAK